MPSLLQQSIKEPSRPFLQREPGQIGIYIDVLEAEQNEQRHGSEHYYVMLLTETLCQEFKQLDVPLIKGELEKESLCQGVVLDGFRDGIVLLTSPDNTQSLEGLINAYENERLSQILQRTLITEGLLKNIRATNINIRIRMWQDEHDSCKEELVAMQNMQTERIEHSDADMTMLKRVKNAQFAVADDILELRDGEDKFEQTLGEFINIAKNPENSEKSATSSLQSFANFTKSLRKNNSKAKMNFDVIDHFFNMVNKLREVYGYVEKEVWYPLATIHSRVENEKQREVKQSMLGICRETTRCLTDHNDLSQIGHLPWENKILPREKETVFGIISLIPMAISRLSDIDHLFDEYLISGDIRGLTKS